MKRLIYVLPVHNEVGILAARVERLTTYLARELPGAGSVYLVENGSRDESWRLCQELEKKESSASVTVLAFREPDAGIGYAYHRGLTEAVARVDAAEANAAWAILTAADLPFGFSDLEAARVPFERSSSRIFMGSKAHPESKLERSVKRRLMTEVYRAARRVLVGMRVGDSQGSVFLRLDLVRELLPRIRSRDFFYTTELCHFAERTPETILELPVATELSEAAERKSTVKPFRDGRRMARQLWQLRKRDSESP